ncbi:MAG: AraC family transcriptional regulator [Clostridia bacterium]|nr:AraC family transcriptional regulator [Clostridia bacterium]
MEFCDDMNVVAKGDMLYIEHTGAFQFSNFVSHNSLMIAYISNGNGFLETENEKLPVAEGDIIVLNSGMRHRFYAGESNLYMGIYYCYFFKEAIDSLWKVFYEEFGQAVSFLHDRGVVYVRDNKSKEVRNVFVKMIDEYRRHRQGYYHVLTNYLFIMLVMIFRNYNKNDEENGVKSQNQLVDATVQYINAYVYDSIKLSKLAQIRHISPSYLCRLFKKHMGMTTTEYINKLKIEKIKDMLKNTDRPINSILELTNNSPEHIKRLFKKYTGMTLAEYRQKYHYN